MVRFVHRLAALLVVLAPLPALAGPQAIKWKAWDPGLSDAKDRDRPVIVDVYTDWCGWCKRMDRDVYARPDVQEYLSKRFVTVKINAEADVAGSYEGKAYTSRSLAQRFRVNGFPTTIFLRANGQHIANVPGYVPADRFLLLLKYIGEGHLDRSVSFDDFVKQQGSR